METTQMAVTTDTIYIKSILDVTRFYNALSNQVLKNLNYPNPQYQAYQDQFPTIQSDGQVWTASVLSKLGSVPRNILNSDVNDDIDSLVQRFNAGKDISLALSSLGDPSDKSSDLAELNCVNDLLNGSKQGEDSLSSFVTTMQTDYQALLALYNVILQLEASDNDTVTRIKSEMQALQSQIDDCCKKMKYDEVGMAASIATICFGVPLSILGVGIIFIAGGVAGLVESTLDDLKQKAQENIDTAKLAQDTAWENAELSDLAYLAMLQTQIETIDNEDAASNTGLVYIQKQWSTMWDYIQNFFAQVKTLQTNYANNPQGTNIQQDVTNVQQAWNNITTLNDVLYYSTGTVNQDPTTGDLTIQLPTPKS